MDVTLPLIQVPALLALDAYSISEQVPYLRAEPRRVREWADRLPSNCMRIGIAWQGSAVGDPERSVPLALFEPLGRQPGVTLISLQKNLGLEQLKSLPNGMAVVDFGAALDAHGGAFLDTAAIIMNLDLIVTSDTAVAHVAGALGRPVWIL